MADIKLKESKKGTIKTLNKAVVGTERIKDNIVSTKEKFNESTSQSENSGTNYAIDKISNGISKAPNNIKRFNQYGKKGIVETKENIAITKQKIKYAKKKAHAKNVAKKMTEASKKAKNAIKTGKSAIKTAENTGKNIKNMEKVVKESKKALKVAKETAKKTAKNVKRAIKATIKMVKAIIASTKALIMLLVAGGWIIVIIIIVICLIAMLVSSVFGIFFSSEDTGSTITVNDVQQSVTMSQVISDLNIEFMNKITQIQQENPYDEYDISGTRAEWKDVLAVYVAKVSSGDNQVEMMTLNNEKVNTLKEIFWAMNEISFTKEETTEEQTIIHLTWTEHKTVTYTKLHITITSKTANEIADSYNFSQEQRNQLAEFQKEEYASMWSAVIYGSSVDRNDIVEVARGQIGNVGGQPYWSWYGFESRVEWCACFVSWCANECGYIDAGIIPKFASCESEGVAWFKTCALWKDRGYIPKARRHYIF